MSQESTVAIYLRISVEDENSGESGSIASQRDIIAQFLDSHTELSNFRRLEFCDDGYSGVSFSRPAMIRMLEKLRSREVLCVVVKDISRFGRNYIEVGSCLEHLFPAWGIRFISINDNYDSSVRTAEDIDVAMKTLVYDLYSKDLSIKCKSGLNIKKRRGEFAAPVPVYGYKKSVVNKNKLEVDEEAAEVVRKIFKLAAHGKRAKEIAAILNEAKILPRSNYKAQKFGGKDWKRADLGSCWSRRDIYDIIGHECYTGAAVANKTERKVVGRPCIVRPKEYWTVVPDAHPAIVNKEEFESAQKLLRPLNTNLS